MRLKTKIWVSAYTRKCMAAGLAVYLERSGDPDAGEILIKVDRLDSTFVLLGPALGMAMSGDGERQWRALTGNEPADEAHVNALIERRKAIDPDLWVVAVEDRMGMAGLDPDNVVKDG